MSESQHVATAAAWARWLDAQIRHHPTIRTGADLSRASGTNEHGRPLIGQDRISLWRRGVESPSFRLAIATADALSVSREDALSAAGYVVDAELMAHTDELAARRELPQLPDVSAFSTQQLSILASQVLAELSRRAGEADE